MKERITRHWDGRAGAYDENVRQVIYSPRERRIWQKTFSGILGEGPLRILDVGTGPGILANLLSELGHEVTGIDTSEGMLKKARYNSLALHNSMALLQGDGERLPFASGSFDAVVNRYVLWTLPQPEAALEEWQRVLVPGGRLVIVDGTWFDRKSLTAWRLLWRRLSPLLILLTEQRVPSYQELDRDIKTNLWSCNVKRPDVDIEMLLNLGFKDVRVSYDLDRRLLFTLNYLKHGHSGKQFLITAIK